MCVCDLQIGEFGIIHMVQGDAKLAKRLSALGCVEGTRVQLKRIAPLGDPMILNLRGYDLAIRKKDAKNISLQG